MKERNLNIAMLSIHSSPLGELGTADNGGMSVYVRELSRELGRAGHQVDIYTRTNGNGLNGEVTLNENVRLIHLDINGRSNIPKNELYAQLPDYFKVLDSYKKDNSISYDLVHSHYWLSGVVGNMAVHSWGIPHLVMFHTTGMAKKVMCSAEEEPSIRLTSERILADESDLIIAPTEKEKEMVAKFCEVSADKIAVIPCGVNLEQFKPLSRDEARKELGFPRDESIVLYVGRFAPVKGVDRLLSAMSYLQAHDGIRLVIVGGDGEKSKTLSDLKKLMRDLGISEMVHFEGRVDHDKVALYYNASDLLVVPSYYESFGLVALESLACGTPVVSTPVGGMSEIIKNDETGKIVEHPDAEELALSIEKLLYLPAEKRYSGKLIRSSVTGHSWSAVALSVLEKYRALSGAGKCLPVREDACERTG